MSQINLNPAAHIAPEVLPVPAASGMSAVAKVVIGVAALFFAIFVYVALSGSKTSSGSSYAPRDEADEKLQSEIARIQQKLGTFFDMAPSSAHAEEYSCIYAKFTSDCPITAEDVEAANRLIAALSVATSVIAGVSGDPLIREQNREFEEALRIDKQRQLETEEERAALLVQQRKEQEEAFLQEKRRTVDPEHKALIQEFIMMDGFDWWRTLSPFVQPIRDFQRISRNYTEVQLREKNTILGIFKAKKGLNNRPLDREVRDRDVEIDRRFKVDDFNRTYDLEEFAEQRASLEKAYGHYKERVIEALGCYRVWFELFYESQQDSPNLDVFLKYVTPKA
ncbi:MAG: hypothetical protein KFB93_07385 [Simkaniaceae bacterium]|nr:MAG: hypothetical protein KFB93_07385 [Simkaniaceae bacterium]